MANLPTSSVVLGGQPVDRYKAMFTVPAQVQLPATVSGSLPLEVPICKVNTASPITIEGVGVVFNAAVTKHSSNYITVKLGYRRDGGNFTAIASLTSEGSSGSLAAFSEHLMTLSAAGALRQGDILTLEITKASSGQNLPLANVVIYGK